MGDAGISTVTSDGNISLALKAAYAECKAKKQNPISINVVQIAQEPESGKWKASIPSRS